MASARPIAVVQTAVVMAEVLWDHLDADWRAFLDVAQFGALASTVDGWYAKNPEGIYPPRERVFRAFDLCALENVKVLILGQDPYHVPGQANGLAFACETDGVLQPSLRNILDEVERSTGTEITRRSLERGSLDHWAEQGVLLLNRVLTVEAKQARSHAGQGWEAFTQHVVDRLLTHKSNLVVMLWGKDACAVPLPAGARQRHLVLEASHPSPYSYRISFAGCDHFARATRYLEQHGKAPVQWT